MSKAGPRLGPGSQQIAAACQTGLTAGGRGQGVHECTHCTGNCALYCSVNTTCTNCTSNFALYCTVNTTCTHCTGDCTVYSTLHCTVLHSYHNLYTFTVHIPLLYTSPTSPIPLVLGCLLLNSYPASPSFSQEYIMVGLSLLLFLYPLYATQTHFFTLNTLSPVLFWTNWTVHSCTQ